MDSKVREEILTRAMGTAFQMDVLWLLKALEAIENDRNYWRLKAEGAESELDHWQNRAEEAEETLERIEKMFDDMATAVMEIRRQRLALEEEEQEV